LLCAAAIGVLRSGFQMNGIASQQLKVKLSKYHALPLIYQIIRSGEISAYRIIMFCLVYFFAFNSGSQI
jgi:hypothetical protein